MMAQIPLCESPFSSLLSTSKHFRWLTRLLRPLCEVPGLERAALDNGARQPVPLLLFLCECLRPTAVSRRSRAGIARQMFLSTRFTELAYLGRKEPTRLCIAKIRIGSFVGNCTLM